jgi:hypothetical protein
LVNDWLTSPLNIPQLFAPQMVHINNQVVKGQVTHEKT